MQDAVKCSGAGASASRRGRSQKYQFQRHNKMYAVKCSGAGAYASRRAIPEVSIPARHFLKDANIKLF